jgi:hypothetical protein
MEGREGAVFEGIEQTPVEIGDTTVPLPAFFPDNTALVAIFPARLGRLRRLLPDRRLRPARLAPGVGTVVLAFYEYRDSPVGDYRELGVLIPLADGLNAPGLALLETQRTGLSSSYLHWLPVSEESATSGGPIWGFPNALAEICWRQDAGSQTWTVADDDGPALTLRARQIPTEGTEEQTSIMHTWSAGQPQSFEVRAVALQAGMSAKFGAAKVELEHRHPRGRELADLLLSHKSLALVSMPRVQQVLFPPDRLTATLLRHLGLLAPAP